MTTALDTSTIQQAQIQDLPEIVDRLLLFFSETPWQILRPDPDPAYVAQWLMNLTSHSQLYVAKHDGCIIGLCGGTIVDFPMIADLPYLWEWCWWVRQDYRHTIIARRLWTSLIEWAREHGAKGAVYGRTESLTGETFRETLQWRWWP